MVRSGVLFATALTRSVEEEVDRIICDKEVSLSLSKKSFLSIYTHT